MRDSRIGVVLAVSGLAMAAGALAVFQPGETVLTNGDDVCTLSTTPGTTEGDDAIRALGGNDTVRTAGGDDAVDGGSGNDLIYGGAGDDVLAGGEGEDSVYGELGDDALYGGPGDDFLHGGGTVNGGDDSIFGGDGDDEILALFGDDTIDGGAGDDEIEAGPGDDTIVGGGGNDDVSGDNGDDVINGGDGDDVLRGGQGNDVIFGDMGEDELYGGDSWDYLDGVEGVDLLNGDAGEDVVIGRDAGDIVAGGSGDDYLVLVSNSITGFVIYDDFQITPGTEDLEAIDSGTDMLCFVRDVNPDQMTFTDPLPPHNRVFLEFDPGLATNGDVTLDLPNTPMLRHIEAFRTGEGSDTVIGRDTDGLDSYGARFLGGGARFIQVNELFFTGGGRDTITTGDGGGDLVDAGEGDDVVNLGPGPHYVRLGGGADVVNLDGDAFDGQESRFYQQPGRCRIEDLTSEDKVVISGSLDVSLFEVETLDWEGLPITKIKYDTASASRPEEAEQFDLLGVHGDDVTFTQVGSVIEIRATTVQAGGPPAIPPVDPTRIRDRAQTDRGPTRDTGGGRRR